MNKNSDMKMIGKYHRTIMQTHLLISQSILGNRIDLSALF